MDLSHQTHAARLVCSPVPFAFSASLSLTLSNQCETVSNRDEQDEEKGHEEEQTLSGPWE